jgi:hypothetical protein
VTEYFSEAKLFGNKIFSSSNSNSALVGWEWNLYSKDKLLVEFAKLFPTQNLHLTHCIALECNPSWQENQMMQGKNEKRQHSVTLDLTRGGSQK